MWDDFLVKITKRADAFHVCSYSDFGGSAPAAKPPKSEGLRTIRKNSKIGGFASTAKTPKSEVLRSLKNISYNIWYSKIGGSAYYTPKSEVLRSFKNISNNI